MAKTIIELPHVGESVTEGVISKWLVKPGDSVRKFDPLVEVMTDKVNMEVPSPFAGRLIRTLAEEGDTVPMGRAIAEIEIEELAPATVPTTIAASLTVAKAPDTSVKPSRSGSFEFVDSVRSVGPTGSGGKGEGRPDALQDAALAAKGVVPPIATVTPVKLSPLVKRLIDQHHVDVGLVTGTGMGGRITSDDVLRFVNSEADASEATAGLLSSVSHLIPLTPLRKTIAQHLERSTREIPAAWTMFETDVTGMVAYRDAQRDAFRQVAGVPLTYLPLTAYVIVRALMENPLLNGRWTETGIVQHEHVNLGVAVSTDAGLLVPVIHHADELGVRDLAVRAHSLITAAREGNLALEDVQGGTFTLNNTGALGSVVSVPIINHPQSAIVTTEAVVKRPVVGSRDTIEVRSMMNLCMAFDHRVCDGAEAARFLTAIKNRLEAISTDSFPL